MKTKIIKNANYIGWIVIILAFVFLYFSYFFIYIPKNESQLQQKGFRILKEYGSNMMDKNKYFENHFKNYGVYYSIKFLLDENEISKKPQNEIDTIKSHKIEDVLNGLQKYVTTSKDLHDSGYFYEPKKKELFLSYCNKTVDVELIDSINKFYKKHATKSSDLALKNSYSYNVPIEAFMDKLKFDELFENIVLFDKNHVFYNTSLGNLADITQPEALTDSAKKVQGGVYTTLNISGEKKHVMILPIDFAGKDFFIAGFITDTDFLNKTRTINKQLLIFIAGIILLVFAGMPILKIIFIDNKERLKARDASGSGVSLLFGIGLFILLIISFSKMQFVDKTSNSRRINMISDSLYSNVIQDIDSIKALGMAIAGTQKTQYSTLGDKVKTKFNSGISFYRDKNLSCPFPLNEIILINRDGIVKSGYTSTPFSDIVKVDLSERQYFRNIIEIDNSWPTADGVNFYIESIKSFNTGSVETAISFYTTNFDSLPVLAITSEIPSLYHQVLPKDIEFVIINKRGKVLYHSIQEKNLHENFILECESELKLINAINTGNQDQFHINYNEKKWLAQIVPIKDTPLFHITLLNLNQADNLNSRIFLFTFYFLIATLVFIILGLLIMRWITLSRTGAQKHIWFLNWLVLQPDKYLFYKNLSVVLVVIILVQLTGFFISVHPISLLFYQLIFIVYSLFATMVFLNRKKTGTQKSFRDEYFTELNVLGATILLIILFLLKFDLSWGHTFPLVILIITTIFVYKSLKNFNPETEFQKLPKNLSNENIQLTYLVFIFLWLTSISAVPIVVYYYSIKNHEMESRNQEHLLKIADDNIEIQSVYNHQNNDWFKRIQGNNIDFLKVSYPNIEKDFDLVSRESDKKVNYAEQIYSSMPDPISNWYNQPKLILQKNHVSKLFENDTLFFKKGLNTGAVSVNYSVHKPLFPAERYLVLVFFVFIIVALSIWLLLKYLAVVLLNLKQEKLEVPKISWIEILSNTEHKRIILNSFDGPHFHHKLKELTSSLKNGEEKITTILASQIMNPGFKIESLPFDTSNTIWITGLNKIIGDFDKHENLLLALSKLNQTNPARIIIDMPFEIDLINEFYDDYMASSELKPEQLTQIFLLREKWKNIFNNYFIYNGYLNLNQTPNSENIRFEDSFIYTRNKTGSEFIFSNVWSNLTSYEKILLFDLADDGLLNRKNKTMIQKLINKRIIIPDPFPAFYSDEFREFVHKSIKSAEVKVIEKKLGLEGSWHNAKYFILLIIIPLAAFIIISQGISVEKVFGIFAGGLAIITGVIRLFDSNIFKQT